MQAGIPAWLNAILALGGLGTLVSGLGVWWKNHRDGRIAERRDGRDAIKDDVEIFSDWMTAAKESALEAREARHEAAKVRDELTSLRTDVGALQQRMATLEDEQGHLVGYVTVIIAGVEAGTVPPLPPMPPTVQAILSHITTKETGP